MIHIISWVVTLGLCLYVFRHSDAPIAVLGFYYLLALLLRWWLVRRISKINERNRNNARNFEKARDAEGRRVGLLEKYRDERIVELIMNNEIWKGATTSMLLDSMGRPHKFGKEGNSEIWCYGQIGKNRYKNRVTLKNGVVQNWTDKN